MGPYRDRGSSLLVLDLFEEGDPRFLGELLALRKDKQLAALAERLHGDRRPFARRALLDYIDDGCDRPHHRALVKRLFKRAEGTGDDEAMGHFLVAFDRLVAHELRLVKHWETSTGAVVQAQVLAAVPLDRSAIGSDPETGTPVRVSGTVADRFSPATRRYLRRRAWRYFRFLGFRDPARYGRAVRAALALYEDRHLASVAQLLDSWGLVHALYHGSPELARHSPGVALVPGRSLEELVPAPFRPAAWLGVRDELLDLAETARSRTVRVAVITWLRREYAAELGGLPFARLRAFVTSPHEELQTFGVELLEQAGGLDRLPLDDWLALLRLPSPALLPAICALARRHVAPPRVPLDVALELAASPVAPVAELGLSWVEARREVPLDGIVRLAGGAEVPAVRARAQERVFARLGEGGAPEHLRELIDARHADVRTRALAQMDAVPRFAESATLWAALPESPYDDVRDHLVAALERRSAVLPPGSLPHVWATALLAVHRGGRTRPRAARQLAERIVARPGEAEELLPLLRVAVRTLRAPDRRAALAALVGAAERRPELGAAISRHLPELRILDDAATALASTTPRGPR